VRIIQKIGHEKNRQARTMAVFSGRLPGQRLKS